MRLRLRHSLHIRFPEPARNVINILRMTPRSHEGQRVTNWRIGVDPDCLLKAGEDHFGNIIHTLTVPGLASEMTITAQGELTSFDASGVVRGTAERLPMEIYCRDTSATTPDEAIRSFATKVASGTDDPIGKLHLLLGAIHETVAWTDEPVSVSVSAAQAFKARRGGSNDHAQIFNACARHLGYPARCVTGFLLAEDGTSQRHTWAEAFVQGLSWIGFDTVHDMCPEDNHIRVAAGLDATEAAAVRGAPNNSITEDVTVTWLLGREPPAKQSQSQASS